MRLSLFFTYYGGKWRISRHYPPPTHSVIIEPFAGSAGYALHYPQLLIRLYDTNSAVCGVWDYLIHATESDILALPLHFSHVDEINVSQEAKWLIGFWLNKATTAPCKQPSKWMREKLRPKSFWGDKIRNRIASQLQYIRHWKIRQKSYVDIPNEAATWFIDPPYHRSGSHYAHSKIDYAGLSKWCKERQGQKIVCEQEGADWLPFEFFRDIKTTEGSSGKKRGREVIWLRD